MNIRRKLFGATLAFVVLITPYLIAEETAKNAAATTTTQDSLIRILVAKGVITADEARFVSAGNNQNEKLLYLLKQKGVLSTSDLDVLRTSVPTQPSAQYQPALYTTVAAEQQLKPAETKPAGPKVVPAVAPLRVLQLDASKKDGLIPDIKLGSGARLKLYGFIKAGAAHDSSSPYGTDFPLPGFIGSIDTGPNRGSEFHVKARSTRLGVSFEWPDLSPKLTFTGKIEFDFEGNFSRTLNRNISTIRSSMPSIRLAYGRMDYKASENTNTFLLVGQDWTPFGSSTLPNLLETTGLGLGFGTLYERDPQIRFGVMHNFGGSRKFSVGPEFAAVMPASGNPPATVNNATMFGAAFTGIDSQLGYGERQGADSGRPQVQGRLVLQWQLDKAPGVVPAQFIVSLMQGSRKMLVPFSQFNSAPTNTLTAGQTATLTAVKAAFPTGADLTSDQKGASVEMQLPTRWLTVIAKYYSGEDLRYYFSGGLYSIFNDTTGLSNTITVASMDGNTVVFGTNPKGSGAIAPQRPVRVQGGFVNVGIPLGRIMQADPASRAAGWQLYLHYGVDDPYSRDVRRTAAIASTSAGLRDKSDLAAATVYWKCNSLVTFGWEQSYYRTRLSNMNTSNITGPMWAGGPVRSWHDVRSEFATIFSF